MQKDEKYIAHALLLQFHLDKSVTEAHDTLRALYGREAVKRSTCEQYFQRFRAGDTTFVECFDYDTSSDEDSEDFVPTKIRRMFASRNASSSQRKPRISIDILADILKHLSRRRLSELEEVNTILRHTSQHRISNVHAIQSVRIYQKDDFAAYLPGNWENVTETIKCSSLKFIRFKRVELDQAFNDETYDPLDEAQNKGN
ncbi:putative histone-lysine N-methyltransferase SETMAR-like [Ditylenchus destructor]|uniref:Histone-lysine N-methyltransferase SETMAR-like n=1 Tax=Ditylenchus destructor TaxID=166010 RepID=A0AAD4QYB0_9BILA|nr:putative histone-lysine N-methyltransferase SETMAR-like [Ditylenchus destructor]